MMIRLCYSILLLILFQPLHCLAVYSITSSSPLFQNETLISSNQIYELGFFRTSNDSENEYLGIWFANLSPRKIVWVANRDRPLLLTDELASLRIASDGNLQLIDGQENTVWSTNVSGQSNDSFAVLQDNGNFVLNITSIKSTIWESFNHPGDTLLSGAMLGVDVKTGEKLNLVSWKTDADPSPGNFVAGITPEAPPQPFTWHGSSPYWRGGQWDRSKFIGIADMAEEYTSLYNVKQDPEKGTTYYYVDTHNTSFRGYMSIYPDGSLQLGYWDDGEQKWMTGWKFPNNSCDVYGVCGPFGVCNSLKTPICYCPRGFTPKLNGEWNRGNWTGGCVRDRELNCELWNASTSSTANVKEDVFLNMSRIKLPDSAVYMNDMDAVSCQSLCRANCSCLAFSYVDTIGCMIWTNDLLDMQEFSTSGEVLHLRLAEIKSGGLSRKANVAILTFSLAAGMILSGYHLYKYVRMQRANRQNRLLELMDGIGAPGESVQMFDFHSILEATNNFGITNKLGQGGFGPVYKGKLQDGTDVAVKRLSSSSGQGIEEFKNEIILISKLQHRNLVKLIGYCIEGEERILVYEYLPKKSLDTLLFNQTRRVDLDWDSRFNIIQGVARGLLYLHRDSTLRIIHRDLKVSNILLDDNLNPKISDFGLARMFHGTQDLINTQRVVGTLGYMAPEYAMGGMFSEKSDVYSFGVLLLEIISSKKNTSFCSHGGHYNLLSYAWKLWRDGRGMALLDEAIGYSAPDSEVLKCIQVGLLCIQDHAADRPNMLSVILMLNWESDLPQPKEPSFTFQSMPDLEIPSHDQESTSSKATITDSMLQGR